MSEIAALRQFEPVPGEILSRQVEIPHDSIDDDIVALRHELLARARVLTRNPDKAADLLQETLVRAFSGKHNFERGTNLRAWLYRIMYNTFLSDIRKTQIRKEDFYGDGEVFDQLATQGPNQEAALELEQVLKFMELLSSDQRELLLLMATGASHEDAVALMKLNIGTVKSRLSRARADLKNLIEGGEPKKHRKKFKRRRKF